ncbi:hypothetical protein C5167_038806 [Papaver somniferum]|uniref:MPN domain-containing protein n=1 Tax=Papaver somniferum TaxID=3469 RepID=A0A4Y7ICV9_PAPSO|nr:ER membrane protein complex subunit 8/9 homolog [Papaver somniferum]RZC45856.1 hypothetical protein C5167_038806 [Papaver somniferum]
MGGELKYEIGQNAYIKLVLHALKHKTSSVNGILIGRIGKDDVIEISDSIPLSHSQIGLLPALELALIQIEEHYGSQGMSVVGYYHGNERYDDVELGNVAKRIGDQIHKYFPQAVVILLDNKKLEALPKGKGLSPVVKFYTKDASKTWRQGGGSDGGGRLTIREPSSNIVLLDCISSEKWQEVVDFDDHLDDISKDWLNPGLFK